MGELEDDEEVVVKTKYGYAIGRVTPVPATFDLTLAKDISKKILYKLDTLLEKEIKRKVVEWKNNLNLKEILERAFIMVDDYSAWDLIEDEDDPMDFENDIKPQIEELKKKTRY